MCEHDVELYLQAYFNVTLRNQLKIARAETNTTHIQCHTVASICPLCMSFYILTNETRSSQNIIIDTTSHLNV